MKNKEVGAIILSILIVIGGMVMNFKEFLMGSPATVKNLIVTVTYIAVWILILKISAKNMNRKIIKYYAVFWSITLFLALLTLYINATGASASFAIPFVILLLSQWYGISFFVGSFLTTSIIIAFISLVILIPTLMLLKHSKEA